jgi:hypothetical protein
MFYVLGRCTDFRAVILLLVEMHKVKVQNFGTNIMFSMITLSNHATITSLFGTLGPLSPSY